MGFAKGEASGYLHLLDRLRQFARGWAHPNKPAFAGVGTGQLTQVSATAASVAETWTLTCTAAAVNGGTFSVVGSVSGAQANASVGVAYANAFLSFLITDGATDFQVGDAFTVIVQAPLAAGDRWVEDRWVPGPPAELIMHGPGAGADAIYVGVTTTFDAGADYYNWKLQGFTGYQPAMAFGAQPGAILDRTPHVPLWQNAIPYWFMVSARRLLVVAKVSTVYEACYLGFLQPYATPSQYPYPLLIGGSLAFLGAEPAATSTAWRWSATPVEHRLPFEPGTQSNITSLEDQMCAVRLRNPAGAWRGFASLVSSAYIAGTLTGGNPANAPPTAANTTLRGNLIWPGCAKTTGFNVRQGWAPSPGTFVVRSAGKKRGVVVHLTAGQRAALDAALAGYLRTLEEALRAGTLADYPLFPAGQMPGGRKGRPVATLERHSNGKVVNPRWVLDSFKEAERLAEVPHIEGRAAYGLRRAAVDAAKEAGISREGLQAHGGWTDSQIPDRVYADQQAGYARDEARRVRAKIRGEE